MTNYLQTNDPQTERTVAEALRPILEAFVRVAYPASFPPGSLLGPFLGVCSQWVGTLQQILDQAAIDGLDELKEYGNRFHHDGNPAWQTAVINDQELVQFSRRTLAFACKG